MRDFKGVRERIEPRFGSGKLEVDPPAVRSRRPAIERSDSPDVADSSAPTTRVIRDVLLDSTDSGGVSSDFARRSKAQVAQREQGYTKASPQGGRVARRPAVQKAARKWNFSWFNRKFAVSVFVVALAVGVYWISGPLVKVFERPIKSVVVEGEFNLISKARATELIGNEIDGDFLQLNLMRLKDALLTDPWVEKVTLNRRWPDTLVVKIAEQKPIARWGDGFLNQRGEIVRVEDATRLSGLPWLQGNEADAIEILQQYQDLSQILRSRGLEVLALKCDNKKSWRLTIKNHVEIALGRDQVMEKIRRFVTVYDTKLNSVWTDVKAIDLRYSNGVAVRWVADSEMAKKYIKSQSQVGVAVPAAKSFTTLN
jgi:cell division protein FtsQ